MIDPNNITCFNLTIPELEENLVFWCLVAGKNATSTAKAMERFLKGYESKFDMKRRHPFLLLKKVSPSILPAALKKNGIARYMNWLGAV